MSEGFIVFESEEVRLRKQKVYEIQLILRMSLYI